MWVIISISSIITPNCSESPLNNYISVIQSSGYLVTQSNSIFANFLCSLVLEAPVIGWHFLFNISYACKVHPLGNYLVTYSSTIWKQTRLSQVLEKRNFRQSCPKRTRRPPPIRFFISPTTSLHKFLSDPRRHIADVVCAWLSASYVTNISHWGYRGWSLFPSSKITMLSCKHTVSYWSKISSLYIYSCLAAWV